MDDARLAIVREPIDPGRLAHLLTAEAARRGVSHGAVSVFLGAVRAENLGRRVQHLEYEAYEPLAVKSFDRIATEVADRWPGVILAIHHRLGRLEIGEVSVGIAALSGHRAEACAASRYAIERVKQISPIWKREAFEGGQVWIEGATADPDDERARLEAYRRACA
ncbi:MAG: molybdenum cofactor biosynthesis protein MoaE [Acidobacteria bacterium]|nr:molybdenum cofactor biosynthesis protein MoaE [Acidobacteriota bacterium]MBI3265292.1 molybdenum cofactor biosynthesis protein MoaE [Acidobacteriota bacterium]